MTRSDLAAALWAAREIRADHGSVTVEFIALETSLRVELRRQQEQRRGFRKRNGAFRLAHYRMI